MEEIKEYHVFCGKCKAQYISNNELDTDNEGKCPPCKEKHKEVAEKVQKIIDQKRATRGNIAPNIQPGEKNGIIYMNYKQLL